jgi:choline-phosphate cytidylyltransferase
MRSRRSLLESRGQSPASEEEHESELERSNGEGPAEPKR